MKVWPVIALLCAVLGCGGRSVPASFPASSPAASHAREAAPAIVTAALDGDPPAPGDPPSPGWPGLGVAPAAPPMGGMDMSGMDMGTPSGSR